MGHLETCRQVSIDRRAFPINLDNLWSCLDIPFLASG
jgi:hypothetical protein